MKKTAVLSICVGLLAVVAIVKSANVWPFGIYTVMTGSMSPTFEAGSVIIVKKADGSSYQAGDILAFTSSDGDMLITHRIMEVETAGNSRRYITRGDANNVDDLWPVPQAHAVGRVVFWLNGLGKAIIFIRTGKGILVVVSLMLLLLLASYVWDALHKPPRIRKTFGEVTK